MRYLLRDRDRIYGAYFRQRVRGIGLEEILTAPRSPWQNAYVERLIGSIRRECLDYVIVLGEHHLRRVLKQFALASALQSSINKHETGGLLDDLHSYDFTLVQMQAQPALKSYFNYYHRSRTHLSLIKDAPEPRAKQPPEMGAIVETAEVGGLHHRYERKAA